MGSGKDTHGALGPGQREGRVWPDQQPQDTRQTWQRSLSTNEAEELADSPNIRLLKAVEESSEDCLRRVASRMTDVCQVLVCVESRQTVLSSALQFRNFTVMCVCVLAGSANDSAWGEGR